MKTLKLTKEETGRKKARFIYRVIEDGRVIATRESNRDYVAAYVCEKTSERFGKVYVGEYFFGRMELVGKGDSGKHSPDYFYGLAVLSQDPPPPPGSVTRFVTGKTKSGESFRIECNTASDAEKEGVTQDRNGSTGIRLEKRTADRFDVFEFYGIMGTTWKLISTELKNQ